MADLADKVIMVVLSFIIVLQILAETASDLGTASDCIVAANDTFALTNLFKKKGVIYIAFMIGIFMALYRLMRGRK